MNDRKKALDRLKELNIDYQLLEHEAAFTIEDMDNIDLEHEEYIIKNLFLRDSNGKRHFLVVVDKDKKTDLKKLRNEIGCSALSFASEERLLKHLDVKKGSVSPLGIINDCEKTVEVIIDKDLLNKKLIGIHPNDNTASVFIKPKDLIKIIQASGNKLYYINI